jgi:hypothetical protein
MRSNAVLRSLVTSVLGALVTVACGPAESSGADQSNETPPAGPTTNTLTPDEIADGWQLLFDGKTTAGWRGYNRDVFPDTGWAVQDGMLVVGATADDPDVPIGGDIVTVETFDSFDLRFEFRLTAVANSGVFYRVQEEEGHEIWNLAPEFQVLDDQAYIDMADMDMEKHLTGDNYDLHSSVVRALAPIGEWNEGRILVDGTHVEHWLNGQKTVEYELHSPEWEALVAASKFAPFPEYGRAASGPIGLQGYGSLVWYRNIKIRPGSPGARTERISLFNGQDLSGWKIHGTERWYVEDGELVCESGPDEAYGYLATEATYRDFDLTLEFKQEANGNSGVFIRSHLDGTRISGWQAEVAPPGDHAGGIYESYGRGWLIQPDPELDSVLKMGEWNAMRIRVVGDRITTWLNGVQMIDLTDEVIGEADGAIALQIHDGGGIKVRWRNLYLEEF